MHHSPHAKSEPMKLFVTFILSVFSFTMYGQEKVTEFDAHTWVAPYVLPTPKDWGTERFPIPISFAPEITYKGVEDIRFAPGWAKATSEGYWSYAFLWYLEGEISLDTKRIESNLKVYYAGLIGTNGASIPAEKLIPVVTSFKKTKETKGDLGTYVGTIEMTDYMAQKPIVLNCIVHVKSCPGSKRTLVFYELSPQPLSHSIWLSLDALWLDFRCELN